MYTEFQNDPLLPTPENYIDHRTLTYGYNTQQTWVVNASQKQLHLNSTCKVSHVVGYALNAREFSSSDFNWNVEK